MKPTSRPLAVSLLAFAVAACATSPPPAPPPAPPASPRLSWVLDHSRPLATVEPGGDLSDLAFLPGWIGDARVVGLGEGTHGSHEMYRLKHRIFEALVASGFDLFILEANQPESERINDYVLGGDGDPERLLADLHEWIWRNEAYLDLIRWMRDYNQRHERKVRFAGVDMKWPGMAMRDVVEALRRPAPALAEWAAATYAPHDDIPAMGIFPMWGTSLEARVPAEGLTGRSLVLSGWMRTAGRTREWAGLWLRVEGETPVYRETPAAEGAEGEWRELTLAVDVPAGARSIAFGVGHRGNGTAWFDGLRLAMGEEPLPAGEADLGFEAAELRGFRETPLLFPDAQARDWQVALDPGQSHDGRQSLRISYDARLEEAVAAARTVLDRLEVSREALGGAMAPRELARLLQNARVVTQALEWRSRQINRDFAMADNLLWILEQEPPGTRVVFSGANGHVGRFPNRAGQRLAEVLGDRYLAMQMTTLAGTYAAADRANRPADHPLPPAPEDGLERLLDQAGHPLLLLDLRPSREDDPASSWLRQPLPVRDVGSLATDRQFAPQAPAKLFDLLVYLRETTAARRVGKPVTPASPGSQAPRMP